MNLKLIPVTKPPYRTIKCEVMWWRKIDGVDDTKYREQIARFVIHYPERLMLNFDGAEWKANVARQMAEFLGTIDAYLMGLTSYDIGKDSRDRSQLKPLAALYLDTHHVEYIVSGVGAIPADSNVRHVLTIG